MLERSAVPEQLETLRARYPQPESAQLAEMVHGILSTLNGDLTARDAMLLSEVEELAATMARAPTTSTSAIFLRRPTSWTPSSPIPPPRPTASSNAASGSTRWQPT
jgi:hypothetical protein